MGKETFHQHIFIYLGLHIMSVPTSVFKTNRHASPFDKGEAK